MSECLQKVYEIILQRRAHPAENSYTCYLFEQGLDKILKKLGEETAETIIAAKNGKTADTVNEIADLLYHLLVMMADQGITPADVEAVLNQRMGITGNLKTFHQVDKNT